MKMLLVFVMGLLFTMNAHAFRAYNSTTNIGLYSNIKCSTGLTCAKDTTKLAISVTPGAKVAPVLATATTITSAQCGTTFYNGGAIEMDLPEASTVPGCILRFVTLNATNFDIDPDAADIIVNTTDAAGDRARNATVGNSITIQAVSASQWAVIGINGTWTDAN